MLRCELENQNNDLKEINQQLDGAIKKADASTYEIEQFKIKEAQTKNEELERLKGVNLYQAEQLLKVQKRKIC